MGEKEKIRENYGKGRRNTGKTHVKEILIFTIGQEHIFQGKMEIIYVQNLDKQAGKGKLFFIEDNFSTLNIINK